MRSKTLLALAALAAAALYVGGASAACTSEGMTADSDVADMLKGCAPKNAAGVGGNYVLAEDGRQTILNIVTRVTQAGALLAIAAIVYSGYIMVTSAGSDEKAGQGKKGLIWGAGGFAVMVLAGPAVNAVINLAYGALDGK